MCMRYKSDTLHETLCDVLFRYRVTQLSCGKTLAELLYGKNLKAKLDLLKPELAEASRNTTSQPNFDKSSKLGTRVQSRNYSNLEYCGSMELLSKV